MSLNKKPKGYFKYFLIVDSETSGIASGSDDVAINRNTGEYYQAVSFGLIVVDFETMTAVDKLYVEIKWDGMSGWSKKAESVHKLTQEYLANHGVTRPEAVELIGNFIINHFGPATPIVLAGHNPAFDMCFLKELMRSEGIELMFSHRMLDTNSIGAIMFNTYNSDDLFQLISSRNSTKHNALEDALCSLKVFQVARALSTQCIGE